MIIPEGTAGNANEALNLVVTLTCDAAEFGAEDALLVLSMFCLASIQNAEMQPEVLTTHSSFTHI